MRQSVCVISEDLSLPLDEGIKIFAHSLINALSRGNKVLGLSARKTGDFGLERIIPLKTNKLFVSLKLWAISRRFRPGFVCYVPSSSATAFSFLRCAMLKLYWPHARIVMVSLQPRNSGRFAKLAMALSKPDAIYVQNEAMLKRLAASGCNAHMLPSGVDLEKFTAISSERKNELRKKYGLDTGAFVVLHVGHLKRARNIEVLAQIQRLGNIQVLLVSSSLPDQDRLELANCLREEGVVLFDRYIPNIQEIYQMSDCYLFPVFSDGASIGTPLSVLEAMACNLPVVAVRYGNLPKMFDEGNGLFYADSPEDLLEKLAGVVKNNGYNTREKVLHYSWEHIAGEIIGRNPAG